MPHTRSSTQLIHYYSDWVSRYKAGAVSPATLLKYELAQRWLVALAPTLRLCDLDRDAYQNILNAYANTHARSTTQDFHHHLKAALLDAHDDGLIATDVTRHVVIKGRAVPITKAQFLNQAQTIALIDTLHCDDQLNWDWYLFLVLKTGMRFAEALAITPADFDASHHTVRINKSWNYRSSTGGFAPTKNRSSNRFITLDVNTSNSFAKLTAGLPIDQPIFVHQRVHNSSINNRLKARCETAGIPAITVHGLRHTHASLLLYAGVSIASVSRHLGHASITTTQKTYLHIIQELAVQDDTKMMQALATMTVA